jgi:hypothetical protein
MDTHRDPDDLSELERRLSAWAPAAGGLDSDAMLFNAGRAAARPGASRFVWPALACVLAGLVALTCGWAWSERAARLHLAEQLRQQAAPPAPVPAPVAPAESAPAAEPTPESLLAARRGLEQGLEAWPPRPITHAGSIAGPPSAPVLQVRHRDVLLEP